MKTSLTSFLLGLVLQIALTSGAVAQSRVAVLKGIDSLYVVVEDANLPNDIKASGIASSIQHDAESELSSRGLQIKRPSIAYLYINLNIVPTGGTADKMQYAYSIQVELYDMIVPLRKIQDYNLIPEKEYKEQFLNSVMGFQGKEKLTGIGITWKKATLGTLSGKVDQIKTVVQRLVKDFANDYQNAK